MKLKSKIKINGKDVLEVEFCYFFGLFKKVRKYESQKECPTGYWDWLELPDRKILDGIAIGSAQLDAWNRL